MSRPILHRALSPEELQACDFADARHTAIGELRKYTGEEYITHPLAVADLVFSVQHTLAMRVAAILHDVVESSAATLAEIEALFGQEVAELVREVTPASKSGDGNRARRKFIDREHYSAASPSAKTIRLADAIHNLRTIRERDPRFARIYIPEKRLEIEVLREGDPILYKLAKDLVRE